MTTSDSSVRRLSVRQELARKSLHLSSVVIPLSYAAGLPRAVLIVALSTALVVALAVEFIRVKHEAGRHHFERFVGAILRDHERDRWSGATWLIIAFLALILFTSRDIAIAGMWALSVGDAAAAIIGRAFSHLRARPPGKTIVGSGACFIATFVGAWTIAHLSIPEALIAAASATAAEWPAGWVDDNVRIAAAVSVAIFLWRMTFS